MATARWDTFEIEVAIRAMPDGREGVLLQFEHGFILTANADSVDELADRLRESAAELRRRQVRNIN